ncbi:MAG: hypothetical protein CSA09_04300 [Candidatus Contendobacter odensis]|uniref:Bacterioferritin-associated ferredoxin n=1 Tax=Candidatus Contendibacter odensensis TaxID=1400860 RepID=A0A2G6PEE8_9GAMM|nr:MAG: hypothetical protein CSA09_04300 [Candidatus Contendobacter odensis]
MFLCICKSVTDREIRHMVDEGARTMGDLNIRFGIGNECGKCINDVNQYLDTCLAELNSTPEEAPRPSVETRPEQTKPVDTPPERDAWFAIDL